MFDKVFWAGMTVIAVFSVVEAGRILIEINNLPLLK